MERLRFIFAEGTIRIVLLNESGFVKDDKYEKYIILAVNFVKCDWLPMS